MAAIIAVLLFILTIAVDCLRKTRQKRLNRQVLADQHGCLPPPTIQNKMPLGIDRLQQIYTANRESRLMELFLFHFRQTGYTLRQVFLMTPAFGTVDPANLEAMLSARFSDWGNGPRRKIVFPLFGDGIFTQEGAAWKHSRDILRPQLFHQKYDDLEVFRNPVENLLEALPTAGIVDLQPLFFSLTLDITTAFLFGKPTNSLRSRDVAGYNDFARAFDTAQKYVAERFRLLDLYWLIGGKEFRQACESVQRFADQIIDQISSFDQHSGEEKNTFLQSVSKLVADRTALRGQIVNVLAAGRDTTACLLSWTFFLLVRHPHVLESLKAEVATHCNGDNLCRTDLRKLELLRKVLRETLRLYPPVPVNTRQALEDTILPTGGGPDRTSPVMVHKGTSVAYSVYTLHRRPDLYGEDADTFRPERWDEDLPLNSDLTLKKWGYLPFSGGPRTCIGLDFALTEAAYTIVRILQKYPTIKLPQGEAKELVGVEKQKVTLVLQIKDGCKVELG